MRNSLSTRRRQRGAQDESLRRIDRAVRACGNDSRIAAAIASAVGAAYLPPQPPTELLNYARRCASVAIAVVSLRIADCVALWRRRRRREGFLDLDLVGGASHGIRRVLVGPPRMPVNRIGRSSLSEWETPASWVRACVDGWLRMHYTRLSGAPALVRWVAVEIESCG